ncbi:MAG: RNA degradosome polyphosphate kinase [Clostridiaceae bacterium]|nr:RNA degradosome polyphosphate kinase [Clostridiaceae bacterium]
MKAARKKKSSGKTASQETPVPLNRFINRELSWLAFNDRVLEEARDKQNPLLERVRFLAITCSNLDEFFMIRVASLKDLVNAGFDRQDPAGMTPLQQLDAISVQTHQMVHRQYSTFSRALLPAMAREGIVLLKPEQLSEAQLDYVSRYYHSTLYPILTPMAIDAARPFPLIANRSLNLCVSVETQKNSETDPDHDFAIVQVPAVVPRLLAVPADGQHACILLEDVIRMHLDTLFSGVTIGQAWCFRIMRNADLDIDEDDASDLLEEIEKLLKMRQWGQVIRLEAEEDMDEHLMDQLIGLLSVGPEDIYTIDGPLDLTFLNQLYDGNKRPELVYPPYQAPSFCLQDETDIFAAIRRQDIYLHHPFDSFDPVIELVQKAARDPDVLAIKQTLYRVSGQSPIVHSLAEAAERGKQVMVLVELKARFDEENNIHWARQLEQAGCHVIYGLVGLKTHSKITLVVRRDEDGIRRYVHLGTGNYNDITARFYTDMGLMTCAENIGKDASAFFNMLSGYAAPQTWHHLTVAPYWLRRELEKHIDLEIGAARAGRPAHIIIKANSLVDPLMIDRLYQAAQSGVQIDLIIRGICCLRPGVAGLSETIRVRSIIGRFLEHSRIFYFFHDGREELFLSSADWMPRNLDRRVELMFPVQDRAIHQRVMEVLQIQLADTDRARLMQPDGTSVRVDRRGKAHLDCQAYLCQQAQTASGPVADKPAEFRFEPRDVPQAQKSRGIGPG